ncbi:MAG: hypothetical protein SPJ97_00095 [Bacteroides sp.]|nr:hypothetical protein [Bacteroides sp.]
MKLRETTHVLRKSIDLPLEIAAKAAELAVMERTSQKALLERILIEYFENHLKQENGKEKES